MTDREKYKRAFSALHASENTETEVMKMIRDTENKKSRKFSRVGRTVLIAAALAAALTIGVLAAGPSVFSAMKQGAAVGSEEYELFDKAENANIGAEPEYVPLPEFDASELVIRESCYDGENILIGVDIDASLPETQFGFGADCESFENLTTAFAAAPDADDSLEHLAESDSTYSELIASLEAEGKDYLKFESSVHMDNELENMLTPEQYAEFTDTLLADGHAGLVYRTMSIGDHIYLENGKDASVTGNAVTETEYGILIRSGELADDAKDLDAITVYVKVKANDVYYYMDLNEGAKWYYEPVGDELVPITIERG